MECSYARQIWSWLGGLFRWNIANIDTVPDMMKVAAINGFRSQVGNLWLAGILSSFWGIWYARNQSRLEDVFLPVGRTLSLIHGWIQESETLFSGSMKNTVDDLLKLRSIGVQGRPRPPTAITEVTWVPPSEPWVKVHTDGASRGPDVVVFLGTAKAHLWVHLAKAWAMVQRLRQNSWVSC